MAESTYQNYRKVLPPTREDSRSIHFLLFPEEKKEYLNSEIERAVSRMQTVIELGRVIREQNNISLKTPCRNLIIISPDAEFHADVRSLEEYIKEELNVVDIMVTADESKFGVTYQLVPDAKALGLKFNKNSSKIRAALPSVSNDSIKKFIKDEVITIAGFDVTAAELNVVRTFNSENPKLQANFTKDCLVILDLELDEELIQIGLAREFINRIQRLRKKAELLPTDDVLYYISLKDDKDFQLRNMLDQQSELLEKYLKQEIIEKEIFGHEEIIREEQEINGSTFSLTLTRK